MSKSILIIDDDEKLTNRLQKYLENFGYTVVCVSHPQKGLSMIDNTFPQLVLLDIMLPDINGFDVCKKIREVYSVPIIMLTARGDFTDKVVGLELGADDYLSKPFEPRELAARIQAVLRRSKEAPKASVLRFQGLTIDLENHKVLINDEAIDFTSNEFEILSFFARNPGKVLSRDQLMDQVSNIEWDPDNRTVDVLVHRLRQKLKENPRHPNYLKTVWGTGYIFIGKKDEIT